MPWNMERHGCLYSRHVHSLESGVLCDDLLATGGTLAASAKLIGELAAPSQVQCVLLN